MDNTHHQRQIFIGIGLAVLATLIWSGNFVIARGVIKTIPPVTLAFYRWLLATIIILPFAWKYFTSELKIVKQLWTGAHSCNENMQYKGAILRDDSGKIGNKGPCLTAPRRQGCHLFIGWYHKYLRQSF